MQITCVPYCSNSSRWSLHISFQPEDTGCLLSSAAEWVMCCWCSGGCWGCLFEMGTVRCVTLHSCKRDADAITVRVTECRCRNLQRCVLLGCYLLQWSHQQAWCSEYYWKKLNTTNTGVWGVYEGSGMRKRVKEQRGGEPVLGRMLEYNILMWYCPQGTGKGSRRRIIRATNLPSSFTSHIWQ